jgi:hypothetical protein
MPSRRDALVFTEGLLQQRRKEAAIQAFAVPPVLTGSGSADAGTGNFGNYPLYIGARAGASLFLNGRIYSLIVRGAATSETQIGQTEQWISNEMGGGYYPTGFDFLVTADGDQLTDASGNPLYDDAIERALRRELGERFEPERARRRLKIAKAVEFQGDERDVVYPCAVSAA